MLSTLRSQTELPGLHLVFPRGQSRGSLRDGEGLAALREERFEFGDAVLDVVRGDGFICAI